MEEKIVKINISELKPHPENEKIYGADEDVSDLKNSILSEGLSVPLKITDKNIIISGHRRWKSCCQLVQEGYLEFSVVNCIVEHYQSTEDELKDIVIANAHRRKNYEQIAREALTLSEIHSAEAEKRMMSGKKVDPTVNLPQGSTRDLTADDLKKAGVKISGTNVSNLIKAVQAIDSYDANGKSLEAALLKRELHKENESYFDSHNYGWFTTENDVYKIEFFSLSQPENYDDFYDVTADVTVWLDKLRASSFIWRNVGVNADSRFISLSTCTDSEGSSRTVLTGKLCKI